jgi:hypothetical protein
MGIDSIRRILTAGLPIAPEKPQQPYSVHATAFLVSSCGILFASTMEEIEAAMETRVRGKGEDGLERAENRTGREHGLCIVCSSRN